MKKSLTAVVLAVTGVLTFVAAAAPGPPGGDSLTFGGGDQQQVRLEVKAPAEVAPGDEFAVAVVLDLQPKWHVWTNTHDVPEGHADFEYAYLTAIEVLSADTPLVVHDAFTVWPEIHSAKSDQGDGVQTYAVFEGHAVIGLPVIVADDAVPGPAQIKLKVSYQACNDVTCLFPMDEERTVTVQITPTPAAATDADLAVVGPDVFQLIRGGSEPPPTPKAAATGSATIDLGLFTIRLGTTGLGFVVTLLVAALGGFLLNLTPCVLPVIPLKIMGLSQSAAGHRGRTLALGLAMAAGVIGFWMLLAALIAFVSGFTATNQLFHYPAFTIGIGLFIALMAIGMCGLFSIQLPKAVYMFNPSHESMHGSFLFGVMTAILSTPCTAPFMGVAAALAAKQAAPIVFITFAAIGAGMAAPYLVLAAFPKLISKMPRTGPASELIKQVMGLLMLAAAAYFVGVGVSGALVSPPTPPSLAYWWFVALFGIVAGGWLAFRTFGISPVLGRRIIFGGLGGLIVCVSVVIGVAMTDKGPIKWVYYTPDRFAEAKAEGNVVVMEFTAEWCLNCKTLEKTVLRNPRVVEVLNGDGVVPIKVDLSGNNGVGKDMLGAVGSLTIPLLVVFDADGNEVWQGDYYTPDLVIKKVSAAGAKRVAIDQVDATTTPVDRE